MHFIDRCTWKSSQYHIIISMMSFMRLSQKLVFHQSKCICAIMHILSTAAMYVSSSSFMYLRFPCYCDACLNSSDLRVELKTLLNTIHPEGRCGFSSAGSLEEHSATMTMCGRKYGLWPFFFLEQGIYEFTQKLSLDRNYCFSFRIVILIAFHT